MWGDMAMRQCQTVDREEWGSELPAQLPFKNLDNFVCLFRGSKLKDPTHPEKKTCHGLAGGLILETTIDVEILTKLMGIMDCQ